MQTAQNQEIALFDNISRMDSEMRTVTNSNIFHQGSATLDQALDSVDKISPTLHRLPNSEFSLRDPSEVRASNREIARENYRGKETEELDRLASKRNKIIEKKFSLGAEITESEEKQLKYIEWQIDRIEDSLIGDRLDELAALIDQQNALGDDIRLFTKQVEGILKQKR
ncbi:hypothetical protein D0962_18915 [Leptolyngbyaceae cyanobacterium CCMR0082]|uniref:Uncharacterized protein n=1 Tax=Adonisia turfae CCMR0082 TaxID=2304604 RepID=A0A6M0S9T5_9CYAN|nr:hypothetical protein [Adonisia turfae]NEZ64833.1 hypothetical protein [Adonisia turfae CCMR0082]